MRNKTQSYSFLAISVAITLTSCGSTDVVENKKSLNPIAMLNQQIIVSEDVSRFINSDIVGEKSQISAQSANSSLTEITSQLKRQVDEIKIAAVSNYPWISQQAVWLGDWSQVVEENSEQTESPVKVVNVTFIYNKRDGKLGWIAKAVVNLSGSKVIDYKINANISDTYIQPTQLSAYSSGALIFKRVVLEKGIKADAAVLKDIDAGKVVTIDLRNTFK